MVLQLTHIRQTEGARDRPATPGLHYPMVAPTTLYNMDLGIAQLCCGSQIFLTWNLTKEL